MSADPNHDPRSPLGYDLFVDTDMRADGMTCSGPLLVQTAILHRLMADTLPMTGAPGGAIQFGEDVRKWVGETIPDVARFAASKSIRLVIAIQRDRRIQPGSVRVKVQPQQQAGALWNFLIAVTARATTAQPVSGVYGVSAATVQRLATGT